MKDLIKRMLIEESKKKDIIVPYKLEDRPERYKRIIYKKIQEYIKNGSVGDLILSNSPIESLPSNLKTVGGNLTIFQSKIKNLPPTLKEVKGILFAGGPDALLTELPKNLKIDSSVWLNYTKNFKIPDNYTIFKNLTLKESIISQLPKNLTILGDLRLQGSDITIKKISENLKIAQDLYINNTPLSKFLRKNNDEEISKIFKNKNISIGGFIYLDNRTIRGHMLDYYGDEMI